LSRRHFTVVVAGYVSPLHGILSRHLAI